jgi:hypothetical protein
VTADAAPRVDRQARLDQLRQFPDHVVVHPVVLGPGLLRGVEVETGAVAEIPGAFRVARHLRATRAGVGRDDGHAQFGRDALAPAFCMKFSSLQVRPGEPVQRRHRARSACGGR